ncbi:MAG: homoserine dehydrogenase [Methanobacteriota archaeon]|nr:MAG: homoserine dehydrogenase [Euryarchaeota archaeon]
MIPVPHRIALLGFGNVGREFARLLLERRAELKREQGLEAKIIAIFTARHGSVENPKGIDLRKALRRVEGGASLETCGRPIALPTSEHVRRGRADIVIELTPLRIAAKQPALDHIVAALRSGKHVVTANKGPVVYHYRRLRELARRNRVGFRYEGTVMDGAPIFNLFQETLRGAHVLSFEGILNSTSNFILSEMEAGRSYSDGVAGARERGLLEADPAMDLEGWDATVKACLLANVLMGGRLRPEDVPRQGIAGIDADRVRRVRAAGGAVKQIARGGRTGRRVEASVSVEELPPRHPLASVDGTSSALRVRTDMLEDLLILERNPGVRQTAYAVYSDLIAIHEGRLHP